jgi:hypothetical protein
MIALGRFLSTRFWLLVSAVNSWNGGVAGEVASRVAEAALLRPSPGLDASAQTARRDGPPIGLALV